MPAGTTVRSRSLVFSSFSAEEVRDATQKRSYAGLCPLLLVLKSDVGAMLRPYCVHVQYLTLNGIKMQGQIPPFVVRFLCRAV